MAMPSTIRQINERRALNMLLLNQGMSRADLARDLGMTRSTASSIVLSLIDSGRVVEVEDPGEDRATRTGRPAIGLELNADHAVFLGADIAASHMRLCAVDFSGKIRDLVECQIEETTPTPRQIAEQLKQLIAKLRQTIPQSMALGGINVSVPGVVGLNGDVLRAPPLGWKQVPLRQILSEVLDPVEVKHLVNDATAFAIADRDRRREGKLNNAVFMLLDEGVGGCIISEGRILQGQDGFAGEIGHIPVGTDGFCNLTGIDGALENFIARRAVLTRFKQLGGQAHSLKEFLSCLQAGDEIAKTLMSEWAQYFGRGLAILTTVLNPQAIIVGGRGADLFPHAKANILQALASHLLRETRIPDLELSPIGPEGAAVGSALMLHQSYFAAKD